MNELITRSYLAYNDSKQSISNRALQIMEDQSRRDRWVVAVFISVALVVAVGLAVAWWITCQNKGMYPAVDMPAFSQGGTWKAYCRS